MSPTETAPAKWVSAVERPFVGRLAPSPTGPLHLGHARSFLIAWWQARRARGSLVLRQEDLDSERSSSVYRDLVCRDLEWLGLDWDGPEWVQSQHVTEIRSAAEQLLMQGDAYPCVCSRGDIQSVSAPHTGESVARYPGTCVGRFRTVEDAERATGRTAGMRARVPSRVWTFYDRIHGKQTSNVAEDVGDFLILRRDKIPSYQLAVVVDDARQGVTHVVRGDDLLDSTARQLFLYSALGLSPPEFCHVPLVVDRAGTRLAKRAGGLSLRELRERGVDPRCIVQWAAASAGMEASEPVTPREVVASFDLDKVPRTPAVIPANW